jgi:hypothetical protein
MIGETEDEILTPTGERGCGVKRHRIIDLSDRICVTREESKRPLGVSKIFLYRLSREGKVPHMRLGARYIYRRDPLERWTIRAMEESVGGGRSGEGDSA